MCSRGAFTCALAVVAIVLTFAFSTLTTAFIVVHSMREHGDVTTALAVATGVVGVAAFVFMSAWYLAMDARTRADQFFYKKRRSSCEVAVCRIRAARKRKLSTYDAGAP